MSVIKPLIDLAPIQLSDENGTLLPGQSTISEANKKGLWHVGVHVVIVNKNSGTILVQKRSPQMFTHPSKLDLSLGGALEYGETFEQAALRETREETGINVPNQTLRFVSSFRHGQIFPKLKIQSKVFGHSYLLFLNHELEIASQNEESSESFFISYQEAKNLVATGSHPIYGRLVPNHLYYQQLFRDIEPYLK
jgi:8-oxo-dGTP pyrophosphatase MutT (NUDIX family)